MQANRFCKPFAAVLCLCVSCAVWGQSEPVDAQGLSCGSLGHAGADLNHYHFEVSNGCQQPIELKYRCDKAPTEQTVRLAPDASIDITCDKAKDMAGQIDYRFLPPAQ
ncbi:hypothetical protein PTE30175_03615 [Pandoraea terrae]|uniref:Lipoprotein n=1 Tax=Pandoraea terrae TaxID=1537710 RepID=A0A5E4X7I5_9BURK|nr:hypothetical protein [Pandoraea terrae]VVE32198.1 hypothetical protein PTE30175_03615 [Pandoraea terrae]